MTTRKLKDRLIAEIKAMTPDVKQSVVESSYIEKPAPVQKKTKAAVMMRKFAPALISMCVVVAIAVAGVSVYFVQRDKNKVVNNATYMSYSIGTAEASAAAEGAYPSVAVVADSKNVIESVRADNADGEILLSAVTVELNGKSLIEGAQILTEAAAKLGYVDVTATANTATDSVNVTFTSSLKINDIMDSVKVGVENYLKSEGIFAVVFGKAYTKEEIVAEINKFDAGANIDDSITELNAKLAARKSYYEEKVATSANAGIAIIKEYLAVALNSLNELTGAYPELNVYVTNIQSKLEIIDSYINIVSDLANSIIISAKNAVDSYVDMLTSVVSSDIKAKISAYIADIPDTVDELGAYITAVAERHAAELSANFKLSFEAERIAITDEAYADFVKKFQ